MQQEPTTERRRYARSRRLERLGYASYEAYLRSQCWRDTKERFRASDQPQDCYCCGADEEIDLHHRTYARVGAERLTDLVALCRRCHQLVHVLERRGDLTLNLTGLLDAQRAVIYAEQRQAMTDRALTENAGPVPLTPLEPTRLKEAVGTARKRANRPEFRRLKGHEARLAYRERKRARAEARAKAKADEAAGVGVPLHQRTYDP